jgi:hypothetical protein
VRNNGGASRLGARMQLAVFASLVLPVDVFPGAATNEWQTSPFGQISF